MPGQASVEASGRAMGLPQDHHQWGGLRRMAAVSVGKHRAGSRTDEP
ncbi:MAG: hypothetical protein ACXV3C_08270 [Actinomycetes bacterium]